MLKFVIIGTLFEHTIGDRTRPMPNAFIKTKLAYTPCKNKLKKYEFSRQICQMLVFRSKKAIAIAYTL